MKRFLLLISVMLVMTGIIKAQDVYSAGSYFVNSIRNAAVYKNGEKLYYASGTSSYNHSCASVVVSSTNDIYWVDNASESSNATHYYYGDIFKNGTRWLSNPSGNGSHIEKLYRSENNTIFAAGCMDINNVRTAVLWRNNETTPLYTLGDGVYESYATCGVFAANFSYVGGYQYTNNSHYGVVWHQGNPYITYPDNSFIFDVAYYNGSIYAVGLVSENNVSKLKVWKDSTVLYTLLSSGATMEGNIYIDAGDVYVAASKVWKNGEVLYNQAGNISAIAANINGVYYAGQVSGQGKVWKDGAELYSPSDCGWITDIYIPEPQCENSDIRTLPFTESFENNDTEWPCWTKIDVDNNNGLRASYWNRASKRINTTIPDGDYCAAHMYGPSEVAQTGWLISPRLYLQPGRDNTKLEFKSYEGSSGTTSMKVMVSTDSNPTNTSSYSEVYSITNQSENWKNNTVDLAAYQGEAVYIAFKYEGTYAKNWYIDDIRVTEDWGPCYPDSTPYTMDFDGGNEPGYCWYVLDNDHSGGSKNWKYNSSENCAYHPWGPQNTPQEGWMFSKSVTLDAGNNYQLSFRTRNNSSGTGMNSSVWIALDENGVPDPSNYTTKLWEESTSSSWHNVNIDLTQYAGHDVRIAFKYEGTYAHAWYVDDFAIEQAIIQYNINVEANNASWGSVTGGGIYDQGANVTITAEPNSGYDFLKWTKDGVEVTTNASYSFTATENATYTAVFGEHSVTYYTISTEASPVEAGYVEGGDVYAEGETATLFAVAFPGWDFERWSDGNTDNPRTVTVTGDATYTALFTQINFTINVDAEPAEGGVVTGSGTYHYGDAVELTATPNEGYDFLQWDNGETNPFRTVIVDSDANYTAYFAEQGTTVYEIAVFSNNPELGTVTGGGVYPEGAVITITATPIGYATFVNWSDGSTKQSRQITVTENATYTANFEMGTLYTINVESLYPSMGYVTGGGEFPAGAEIQIQATAYGGFYFNGWDDDNFDNPRTITVEGNATYKARFSQQQAETYTVTVLCTPSEGGQVIGGGNFTAGSTTQIAAIPNNGWRFKEWNDGNTDNPRTITVNANVIYIATFEGEGVDEYNVNNIVLYPNPANDVIRLDGIKDNSEVRIYNTIGELVKVVNVDNNEAILVNDLSSGLYIVRSGNAVLKFTKK